MPKVIQKRIGNKRYFYTVKRVCFAGKCKKLQVYIGKDRPKNLKEFYNKLKDKEINFVFQSLEKVIDNTSKISVKEYKSFEKARIDWEYYQMRLDTKEFERLQTRFIIDFIFESNAIEGSRLKLSEVESIVRGKYIKKSLDRKEIKEVENAIDAFRFVFSKNFKLNQRSIIALHAKVTDGLGVPKGYKKRKIIVNNKDTTLPGRVRPEMSQLLAWWSEARRGAVNPFEFSVLFHQKFEHIHPFEDGNGRTGRILLNWMLAQYGYWRILIKNSKRTAYFSALDKADDGRSTKLMRFMMKEYRKTIEKYTKR